MDKWVIDILSDLRNKKFTGKLEINMYAGGVGDLSFTQKIKNPCIENTITMTKTEMVISSK